MGKALRRLVEYLKRENWTSEQILDLIDYIIR